SHTSCDTSPFQGEVMEAALHPQQPHCSLEVRCGVVVDVGKEVSCLSEQPPVRMAVDIGGTFTDVVLERGGSVSTCKVLTTASRPEEGALAGARQVLGEAGLHFSHVGVFVPRTTLAPHALIQPRRAPTPLIPP